MTTILQTSTGATIIILTALNSGIISVDMALGLVIGANMGSAITTTLVGFLSSTKTQNTKRQVAFGHFTFNVTLMVLVTLIYQPFKELLYFLLGNDPDPVILLALFHTLYNLLLTLIWAPLLKPLIRLLQWMFPRKQTDLHLAIEHINTTLPEEIITALHKDTMSFLERIIWYNRASLMLDGSAYRKRFQMYDAIKQMEEKLLEFAIYYTKYEYTPQEAATMHILHDAIVDGISSAKYIKDVSHHLENIKDNSLEEVSGESYALFQEMIKDTTETILEWRAATPALTPERVEENIKVALTTLHSDNDSFLGSLSTHMTQAQDDELHVAEIIKSNRYVLLSCENLLHSYEKRAKSTPTFKKENS